MEKQLPKKWVECSLGEIAEWGSGGTPNRGISSYYNGTIPWLKTGDLNDGLITEVKEFITDLGLKNSSAKIFPKNSVVIAMYGATIGKTGILDFDSSTNQACAVAIPYFNMNRFIYLFLKSEKENFIEKGKGGAQPNISQAVIKSHRINLPPLPEQNRIVAKLDKMFTQLETIKASMVNIPLLLKDFRKQVLAQAVNGKLTEDWRKANQYSSLGLLEEISIRRKNNWLEKEIKKLPENSRKNNDEILKKYKEQFKINNLIFPNLPKSWSSLTWDEISDWITYGFTRPMPHHENGIPIVTGKNVKDGVINFSNLHYTSQEAFDNLNDKDKPQIGDLLITKDGTIGRAALVNDTRNFCINQSVAVAWLRNTPMNRHFLLYVMMCESVQNEIKLHVKGVAIQHLSVTDFRKMQVPIPSIEEQNEIVNRLESLFTKADAIEKQYKSLKEKIENLPQSLLHKAFKGELTEHLESDGDARELLKEIKALKAASGKVGKKVGKTVKRYEEKEVVVLDMVAEPREKIKLKVVKIKPTNAEIYKRTLLAAEIVYQLKETNTLGHLKLQKMLYLCQEIGSMNLPMNFLKQAMGPYDNLLARSLDKQFVVKKWFEYQKEALLKYKPLENCGNHKEDFQKYFETEVEQINYLINKFKKFTSNQIEAVATLYACWKEAIEKNELITDKLIITKFYQWSKEKEKFREENLFKALDWMRRNDVEPK